MDEKVFFERDQVKVTNARFIVGGQTFAMKNITSVQADVTKPNRLWPILLVVLGLFIWTKGSAPAGITFFAAGLIILATQRTKYHVTLRSAGGETKALTSQQHKYVADVVAALNESIVHGGA